MMEAYCVLAWYLNKAKKRQLCLELNANISMLTYSSVFTVNAKLLIFSGNIYQAHHLWPNAIKDLSNKFWQATLALQVFGHKSKYMFEKLKFSPDDGALRKVKKAPRMMVRRGIQINAPNCMEIDQIVVELFKTTNVNCMVALEEKSEDHSFLGFILWGLWQI